MADRRVVIASLPRSSVQGHLRQQRRHRSGGVGIGLGVVRNVVTQDDPVEGIGVGAREARPTPTHPCPKGVSRHGAVKVKYEHCAIY